MTDSTSPKPFVFVLMPFAKEFDDIYKLGIKDACQKTGAYCERVDEQIFTESILERIYNQVGKADIIIADMSTRNPNVFYETGYAHALGKQVILLTKVSDDIPFDMEHYPHIIYGESISFLKDEVKRRVEWCIQNPNRSLNKADVQLEFFINGIKIDDGRNIGFKPRQENQYAFLALALDVHNNSRVGCDPDRFQIGIIGDWAIISKAAVQSYIEKKQAPLPIPSSENLINLPDGRRMQLFKLPERILPNGWSSVTQIMLVKEEKGSVHDCILRLTSEIASKDISFQLTLINQ